LAPFSEVDLFGATVVQTEEGATSENRGRLYEKHASVNHSTGEYVRGDVRTNTIEGYFFDSAHQRRLPLRFATAFEA
jgi:hypothetical protein